MVSGVSEIGSWSCQLWYHHPSWVLTLLTKRDLVFAGHFPFSADHFSSSTIGIKQGGGERRDRELTVCDANFERSYDLFCNLVLVKLDRGRVNCGAIILRGC